MLGKLFYRKCVILLTKSLLREIKFRGYDNEEAKVFLICIIFCTTFQFGAVNQSKLSSSTEQIILKLNSTPCLSPISSFQGARSVFEHLPHEYIEPSEMKQAALEGGSLSVLFSRVLFSRVLFSRVLFSRVLFSRVLFSRVLFSRVLFSRVLFSRVFF